MPCLERLARVGLGVPDPYSNPGLQHNHSGSDLHSSLTGGCLSQCMLVCVCFVLRVVFVGGAAPWEH